MKIKGVDIYIAFCYKNKTKTRLGGGFIFIEGNEITGGSEITADKIKLRTNEEIRASQVLLISKDGEKIGKVDKRKALERAAEDGLDLVEVAPKARPPVCKIMDYSRYYYEMKKKKKENRKKSKTAQMKQIRLSPNIGKHDLKVKFNKIKKFLKDGHKVKVNMMFKGRQKEHLDVGKEILTAMIKKLEGTAECKNEPNFEGFYMSMLLVPASEGNSNGEK